MIRITAPVLALLLAAPLTAQEWQVAREQFPFAGTRITIQVDTDAPGTLRLIRGEPGSVRVASRAGEGFTSSGLAEDDRLTLSAAGAGPVDYLVAIPENVWVDVRLPGRVMSRSVARGQSGSWEWNATDRSAPAPDRSPGAPVPQWVPGMSAEGEWENALYTTFTRDLPPDEISVPDLATVARVSVRIEGSRFRVVTSRPLEVDEGSSRALVIRPADPPMDVVLGIPTATGSFTLRLGGTTALVLDGASVTTLCSPVTEQRLSDGRRWYTFNPLDGSLDCGPDRIQRHGG